MNQIQAPTLHIPADVRERITAAAAELFEQSGREAMPTVDAVRRAARVDMNAASSVMKEWRRAQTAQAAPVAVAVPEAVQQASSAALVAVWLQAQELANESLRTAQAAWETERGELDAMRQELAEAFERQAVELDAAGVALVTEKAAIAQQLQELASVQKQLAEALSRADKAEARIAEIEHRAADLRAELDRVHADADRLHAENNKARQQGATEIEAAHAATESVRFELVKVQAKAEAMEQGYSEQRKTAAAELAREAERLAKYQAERDTARENAAHSCGKLEATQAQITELMRALAERTATAVQPESEFRPSAKTVQK